NRLDFYPDILESVVNVTAGASTAVTSVTSFVMQGEYMPIRLDVSVLSRRLSTKFALVLLTAVAVITLAPFTARTWRHSSGPVTRQPLVTLQNTPDGERPEVRLITLTPDGYIPSEITRPKGKFLLVVDDRSGLPETSQKLERLIGEGNGEKLKEAKIKRTQTLWTEEQDLPPGEYLLTEAKHPSWKLKITVTPE